MMIEPRTVTTNQEYYLQKRSYDLEQNISSKRIKCDISESDEQCDSSSISDTDTESKCSVSDTDQSNANSDVDDDSSISTDQSRPTPVVSNQTFLQPPSFSRHSQRLIKQFQYLYDHSHRKSTKYIDENLNSIKKLRWELRNTFNRIDLLKEGYAVLSDESFPFYSLCYMCGSMGRDLIYCNNCCQAYHPGCLNDFERPCLYPTPESWLCPNCTGCNICGLISNSPLITCFDCKRIFHIKCLKQSKDDQQYVNIRSQIWFCPLCIKCDCGEKLISTEENLLSLTKSFSSQQSLMCNDCLNNIKLIRTNKIEKIEKCHLCEKFIEQFLTKPKPLFSLTLIGNQSKGKINHLFQCLQCKHRFHPICDGYLNEDVTLIPLIKNISINMICSKCDGNQREKIRNVLMNYKLQVVKNTISSITATLQIIISEDNRLNDMKRYMSNLQQLHQSRNQSINLHAFINDLLIIIQRLLDNLDTRQWQAAIDNCINNQCPWFKSSNLSSNNKTFFCSSINTSLSPSNVSLNRCFPSPSIDHTYALNNDQILFQSNLYKNHLLTSSDSLLRYMDNKLEQRNSFENLYQIDTRICQLCQTYADHFSSNISRLISIGINQWVHLGCILPAYTKTLDQSPYILHNIRGTVNRCQTKFQCDLCLKLGASVQCYINECNARFHCQCLETYYSKLDRNVQEKLNLINGLLPNLTTLCLKHSRRIIRNDSDGYDTDETNNNDINLSKIKSINLSSTVYADLSESSIEFSLTNIKLCIGSLQIQSLGNFDYLLDNDPHITHYPNHYHASRLFWSTKNAHQKTIYHLHIEIDQSYHNKKSNHQTIAHPLSNQQIHLEQLYKTCEEYFQKCHNEIKTSEPISIDTKTLRNLFKNNKSSNLSRFALALVQALQLPSTKLQEPIFSYYLSHSTTEISIPQIDGNLDEEDSLISSDELIQLYHQQSLSKFGRVIFTIISDDGYKIVSDNLDQAWSTIVNLVRDCRDDMNLTHLSMTNEELNGHQIFGLTKSMIKIMLNQIQSNQEPTGTIILSNSNCSIKKKNTHKKLFSLNSRLNIYQRKSSQRQRFNWLLNPNRKADYALKTFEIDEALAHTRRILLEESSIRLHLYHLHYFSERVLMVGSSAIHGCGLFTLIDLIEGQMIIEYTGEVVRPCLTDKRERENERKGFGCYMFTVDSMDVIDATHQGNKARFINHHCQPNCFAKTVISGGIKHIVIYALVDINRGSELTYDYSFPEEDIKIPCHCGTSRCRIYLN